MVFLVSTSSILRVAFRAHDAAELAAAEQVEQAISGRGAVNVLTAHDESTNLRARLRSNRVLRVLSPREWKALEPLLALVRYRKGQVLARQGSEDARQFFVVKGMLKRVVSGEGGRRMILRFAWDSGMDTSYVAQRSGKTLPYSIVAATQVEVAEMSMRSWIDFLDEHAQVRQAFDQEVMRATLEMIEHCVALLTRDGQGRVSWCQAERAYLEGWVSDRDLAAYLGLSAETLSRLKQKLNGREPERLVY